MAELIKTKNVALALSSGGARGLAHIGAIEELEEQGYNITSIAGCSMGALVGGVYAAGKLNEELNSAQVVDKANIKLNKISFGTKVTLLNLDTNQNVVYNILGPWESVPEKNIISYQAPLADEMLEAEVGEELHFEINGTKYNFKVLAIEVSDLL